MPQGLLLWFSDLAHSLIEGKTKHLDEQVDGIASELTLRPTPTNLGLNDDCMQEPGIIAIKCISVMI